MKIQQIRNATLKIQYSSITILLDPWASGQGHRAFLYAGARKNDRHEKSLERPAPAAE